MADALDIRRCVVLAGRWDFGVRRHVGRLADAFPDVDWLVLIHRPGRTSASLARSQVRNLRRHGWRWIPYRIGRAWEAGHDRMAPRQPDGPRPGECYGDSAIRARPNVRVEQPLAINSPAAAELIRTWGADLGIAVSAPLLRPHVFDAPRLGSLNIHRGRIPEYRGMPVAFWELHDGVPDVGCTVHRVVERLDAGDILLEESVPVPAHATVRGMQIMLQDVGIDLLVRGVSRLRDGTARWRKPEVTGRPRTRPPLAAEAALRRRLAGASTGRQRGRRVLRAFALALRNRLVGVPARVLRGLAGRQHVVVLLYHRVNDDMRDTLTTGIERFDCHLTWLRRHCRVIRLQDFVDGRVNRHSLRPLVAITFDDGYRDNIRNAAPLLERHGLPATFFVATGIIGTDRPFPHDIRDGGIPIPAMNWDEVRALRDAGFGVGSHTETHIDCGRAPLEDVRRELVSSRATLQRELQLDTVTFAYPYGGRDNITPSARQLALDLGFAACLSAYGGSNAWPDRQDIRRKGIHHDFDLESLSGRIHGRG
jgi:peptidoglycan/xylan/chitin deacetylase (PgdA/CDA1 family)